jgi:hypothetical protein
VEGWSNAPAMNVWSSRRKDSLFNGEPKQDQRHSSNSSFFIIILPK